MREIKFRAWDEVGKNWIYFDLTDAISGRLEREGYKVLRLINIGRSTGLSDKNGVEIYEGDLVRYGVGPSGYSPRKNTGLVVWEGEGAYFRVKRLNNETGVSWNAYGRELWCEVIGNIYENKELLK